MPVLRKRSSGPTTIRREVIYAVRQQAHNLHCHDRENTFRQSNELLVNNLDAANEFYQTAALLAPTSANEEIVGQATVVSAVLRLTPYRGRGARYPSRFAFENVDTGVLPTTRTGFNSKAKTSFVNWTAAESWVANAPFYIELKSILQTVVNRPGYDGGALLLCWQPPAGTENYVDNTQHQSHSFASGGLSKALSLEVTFDVTTT